MENLQEWRINIMITENKLQKHFDAKCSAEQNILAVCA